MQKNEHEIKDDDQDGEHETNANLICRFYRKDFPDEGELVVTEVSHINESGGYVDLLEYNRLEGLILPTEVTTKRVKSVKKLLKIGKKEIMCIIRVDKEKKYIDLSKKKVKVEEAEEKEKFYKKSKLVHNILK